MNSKNALNSNKSYTRKDYSDNISMINCVFYIGSEWWKGIVYIFLISAKLIFELVFVTILKQNSSPHNTLLSLIELTLHIVNIIFCLRCFIGNPGIIPRNNHINPLNTSLAKSHSKLYVLKGRTYRMEICTKCFIACPLGTGHCEKCNVCIEKYNHHSECVGNCIGKYNYHIFYYYLISSNIYFLFCFCVDLTFFLKTYDCINTNHIIDSDYCRKYYAHKIDICDTIEHIHYTGKIQASLYISIILGIINGLALIFSILLFSGHTVYLINNQTPYLRSILTTNFKVFGNPFNYGCWKNIKRNLCFKFKARNKFLHHQIIPPKEHARVQTRTVSRQSKSSFANRLSGMAHNYNINDSCSPINFGYNNYFYNNNTYHTEYSPSNIQSMPFNNIRKGYKNNHNSQTMKSCSNFSKNIKDNRNYITNIIQPHTSRSFSEKNNSNMDESEKSRPSNICFVNHADDSESPKDPNVIIGTQIL